MKENSEILIYESGRFTPLENSSVDAIGWQERLQAQGYGDAKQVWGLYPDVYLQVSEKDADSGAECQFAATLVVVRRPYRVLVRDLNSLLELVSALSPLFTHYSRADKDSRDALVGLYE